MWLLQAAGDEERFVSMCPFHEPTSNLPGVLAVFVLLVGQPTSSVAGRRLGV
jgi:hypothetical protein